MGTGGIISQVSKRCQVVKKMSNVKKIKHLDYGGGSEKKIN